MLTLYPEIEPYQTHLLARETLSSGKKHEIYVEECGNPSGIPVVFLHGGPGSGCRPQHRQYFNPEKYRIVLFDQRGCGRSIPSGELENNTTAHLISDMEYIRTSLGIDKWVIFGGSWGATLALCYARDHADRVMHMILRGTFLGRQQDIDWVYAAGGASKLFPEAWHRLTHMLDSSEQQNPLKAYYTRLTDPDESLQMSAATLLNSWEATIVTLRDYEYEPDLTEAPGPLAHSRIQLHFALNQCFIGNRPILSEIASIRHIPTWIIHGRYDIVCPLQQSWELHQAWPETSLTVLPVAGHAAGEPAVIDALVKATDALADELQ